MAGIGIAKTRVLDRGVGGEGVWGGEGVALAKVTRQLASRGHSSAAWRGVNDSVAITRPDALATPGLPTLIRNISMCL
ncbi:unnamed protein product, partial [Brenthis ino]